MGSSFPSHPCSTATFPLHFDEQFSMFSGTSCPSSCLWSWTIAHLWRPLPPLAQLSARASFLPSFPSGQSNSTHRLINPDQRLWMPHVYIWRLPSSLYKPKDEFLSPCPIPGSVKPHLCLSYLDLSPTVCTFVPPAFLKVKGKVRRWLPFSTLCF